MKYYAKMLGADLDKGFISAAAEIKTLEGREMLVGLIISPTAQCL